MKPLMETLRESMDVDLGTMCDEEVLSWWVGSLAALGERIDEKERMREIVLALSETVQNEEQVRVMNITQECRDFLQEIWREND